MSANFSNLGGAVARSEGPKGRAGFDRLKLLRIANHDQFRSSGLSLAYDPLHLPRAYKASFIDHQDIIERQALSALSPRMLQARQRPGLDA
ncbi:hypothetical protein D3C87_1366160 [compost metagenome]